MAEPENHTLHLLRELRDDIKDLKNEADRNHAELKERFDSLLKAMVGESVLGRYATADFEQRLTAVERRVLALEDQR
jgi:polyhydroxyalkanoate synthesis regulator phasin